MCPAPRPNQQSSHAGEAGGCRARQGAAAAQPGAPPCWRRAPQARTGGCRLRSSVDQSPSGVRPCVHAGQASKVTRLGDSGAMLALTRAQAAGAPAAAAYPSIAVLRTHALPRGPLFRDPYRAQTRERRPARMRAAARRLYSRPGPKTLRLPLCEDGLEQRPLMSHGARTARALASPGSRPPSPSERGAHALSCACAAPAAGAGGSRRAKCGDGGMLYRCTSAPLLARGARGVAAPWGGRGGHKGARAAAHRPVPSLVGVQGRAAPCGRGPRLQATARQPLRGRVRCMYYELLPCKVKGCSGLAYICDTA